MSRWQALLVATVLLAILSPIILVLVLFAALDSRSTGLFTQTRIGQHAQPFTIYKLRTMVNGRVTTLGRFLRRTKLDELPQLVNVIKGDMTFVGPRPDLPGYYDRLEGSDRNILKLKPGLTSRAAIKYRNEERLLQQQEDPEQYNDRILFPDKVSMNMEYLEKRSLQYDLKIIWITIISLFK